MATSFVRYVLSHRTQDNKYGDLARDVMVDPWVATKMCHSTLRAHMVSAGACEAALETVDELYVMYKAECREAKRKCR